MAITLTPSVSNIFFDPNVGWRNSWIVVDNNQNRPLFAQASYVTNFTQTNEKLTQANELLTALINEIRQKPDDNGFDFFDDTELHIGNYETLEVVSACKIAGLTADNTYFGNLSNYELPQGFQVNGQIYAFNLEYGAVIAYKVISLYRFPNSLLTFGNIPLVTLFEGQSIVTFEG